MSKLKYIYITAPRPGLTGGVATFVSTMKGRLAENEKYLYRGGGKGFIKPLYFVGDTIVSLLRIVCGTSAPIFVNTSMNNAAWNRDRVLIYLLSLFGKRVHVFIHGWNQKQAKEILQKSLNVSVLNRCQKIFTLQEGFKKKLLSAGVIIPIVKAHTAVDQKFINHFSDKSKSFSRKPVVLFLARIEEDKGIMLFLKAISEIAPDKYEYLICGTGSRANEVRKNVISLKNTGYDISYLGRVEGREKLKAFEKSHLYIFPTTHGEGMPISLLEAMVAGLVPIVSRQVALESIVEQGVSGIFINNMRPKSVAEIMMDLCENKKSISKMSKYNMTSAPNMYSPSKLAESIIQEVILNV